MDRQVISFSLHGCVYTYASGTVQYSTEQYSTVQYRIVGIRYDLSSIEQQLRPQAYILKRKKAGF